MSPVYTTRSGAFLVLRRIYHHDGTIGAISYRKQLICFSIERAWARNEVNLSCIPEGIYKLERSTYKTHEALLLTDVPGRTGIFIHPANDASKELRGCIAPVTALTGADSGTQSRQAMRQLMAWVRELEENHGAVHVYITGQPRKRYRREKEVRHA